MAYSLRIYFKKIFLFFFTFMFFFFICVVWGSGGTDPPAGLGLFSRILKGVQNKKMFPAITVV
ncbi:hypothetical protein, partial [Staphylococcus epidermidis]|uniref:hypothetical protein n=1 Tax=Staphylococcus epidermidis TaxID=1282 RepID=UPI00374957B7